MAGDEGGCIMPAPARSGRATARTRNPDSGRTMRHGKPGRMAAAAANSPQQRMRGGKAA
jgi:hypothetical protein